MTFVVDTNVLVVSNGRDWLDRAPGCVSTCVRILREIQESHSVAVDYGWQILGEYKNNVSESGEPGLGDGFLKWLLTNLAAPSCCFVAMMDFPERPDLSKFDPKDRKFVQVALAHDERPPVLQATDRKWRHFENALRDCGITVRFLCD